MSIARLQLVHLTTFELPPLLILALQSILIKKIQQDCAVESDISTPCLTK